MPISSTETIHEDFAHVYADFELQGFMRLIGATFRVIAPGRTELRIPFRPELAQQHGHFHGAISGAAADTTCGYAALSVLPPGSSVLAVEYSIQFLEPALGDELIARGEVLRAGKRLVFCRADLLVVRDGQEHLSGVVLETVSGRRPAATDIATEVPRQ
jgi:uncharacterized protein (TIGR00369 family)